MMFGIALRTAYSESTTRQHDERQEVSLCVWGHPPHAKATVVMMAVSVGSAADASQSMEGFRSSNMSRKA